MAVQKLKFIAYMYGFRDMGGGETKFICLKVPQLYRPDDRKVTGPPSFDLLKLKKIKNKITNQKKKKKKKKERKTPEIYG